MKKIYLLSLLLLSFSLCKVFGQTPVILERYVNTCVEHTTLTYSEIRARGSDQICSSGSQVHHVASGDVGIATITDHREGDETDDWHDVRIEIDWAENSTGIVLIDVYYQRKEHKGWGDCDWDPWTYMYTYKIYKGGINPEGTLTGVLQKTLNTGQNQPAITFNLEYKPKSAYTSLFRAERIRYHNGIEMTEETVHNILGFYLPVDIEYHTSGFGLFQLTVEVKDNCDNWFQAVSTPLVVRPSCHADEQEDVSLSVSGDDITIVEEDSYRIVPGNVYSLDVQGITNFSNHYEWFISDGGNDIVFSDNTFVLNKGLGSYTIGANRKPGRDACAEVPGIKVFSGGQDATEIIEETCPVVLPDDLPDLGYTIDPDDVVLKHFAATVESERSITIMPGITLDLGAELIVNDNDTGSGTDTDQSLNYIEQASFDEYDRVVSISRSYFDDRGQPLQTQYKNLSSEVVLANSIVYDAYGRGVITTLSAPVRGPEGPLECPQDLPGSNTHFAYKPDFVKAADGTTYNHTHFDLVNETTSNEETPVPVDATTEGTLGWYYSANNGTSEIEAFNEPLVAATSYPYTRTLYHRDGSGEVKSATKPGDAFRAGAGHLGMVDTEEVLDTDVYLNAYLDMRELDMGFPRPTVINGQFFRTVAYDEAGKKSVTYTDKGGKTIISLYFADQQSPITTSYQFYNDAGNLLVSVSPNGILQYQVSNGVSNFDVIDKTTYTYNFKGWLLKMCETDAGCTEYMYRKDGKIRFSQNAEQATNGRYSYTHYDRAGRPVESGEYIPVSLAFKGEALKAVLENVHGGGLLSEGTFVDQTFTYYDLPAAMFAETDASLALPVTRTQRFVHGAVSISKNNNATAWYSYDERGRAEWMVQRIENLGVKTLDYRYGPTGAVQEVVYQKGAAEEQFTHLYEYDADGRLKNVYTTRESLAFEKDGTISNANVLELQATYYYYLHGPLKRVEYANDIQGIDYTYTADGALKSINHFDPTADPGADGTNNDFRPDVFGMTLDYYSGDYTSAHSTSALTVVGGTSEQQFGGLIQAMRWHGPVEPGKVNGYAFTYDNRYQFKDAAWGLAVGNTLTINPLSNYKENIGAYDANGNIQSLNRSNHAGGLLANFAYEYTPYSNRLSTIQHDNTMYRSYQYNLLGQTEEQTEADGKKMKMTYDVSGKVTAVRNEEDKLVTTFAYDDRGFRVSKTAYDEEGDPKNITWYVRDASGNVVSTYEDDLTDTDPAEPTEMPVYASGKIGLYKPQYGLTYYEVTDHLGNVRAVIGDKVTLEYMATMEPERVNVGAENDFVDITPVPTATLYNHTPAAVTIDGEAFTFASPNKVIRINNALDQPQKPVGGGIMLWVHPGDKISAEVFAKYANFDQNNTNAITGIAGYLAASFGPGSISVDGANIFANLESTAPSGVFSALADVNEDQPKAFLTYVLFDRNMIPVGFDYDQVSDAAAIPVEELELHEHERLFTEVTVEKEGFIYIYVSNQSNQNMDVYFDDLKVTHEYSDIVGGGDFYPFGLAIKDRTITREDYPYGYQGQFAEKDEETGWNHFELREYDPVIGRWLQTDPAGEFYSPYVGMGNNGVKNTDPDGGCTSCPQLFEMVRTLFTAMFGGGAQSLVSTGQQMAANTYQNTAGIGQRYEKAMSYSGGESPGQIQSNVAIERTFQQIQAVSNVTELAMDGTNMALSLYSPFSNFGPATSISGSRVFWSGSKIAKLRAMSFAKSTGRQTLEMTLPGRIMNTVSPYLPRSISGPIWRHLSGNWARGASGNTHFFQATTGARPTSIWVTLEKPTLLMRPTPVNVISH